MKLGPSKLFNYLITLVIVALAVGAAVSLYSRYIENPWTRDGQVRANIVGIAPRVSGPIIRVAVRDNQQVREGDLLFEIDPSDFQAQVDIAAGRVQNDEAIFTQQQQNLERQTALYRTHVTTTALLPSVSPTIDWVRLPQRFAVRIQVIGETPVPLRIGQTVSVAMTQSFEPVTGSNEIANRR